MGVVTGVFQYTNGSPVANGPYQWKLSNDAILFSGSVACVCPPIVNGSLDANGNMTSTFAFNDVLSTTAGATTYYQLTVKAQNGGQVWNESYYLTGTAANLNVIPPAGIPIIVTTPVSNVLLQTNAVSNADQVKLNQANGPGVSIVADGVGDVTFSANLVAGTNITLATSTANAITINSTGGGGSGPTFSAVGYGGFFGPGVKLPATDILGLANPSTGSIFLANVNEVLVVQCPLSENYVIGHVSIKQEGSTQTGAVTVHIAAGIYTTDGATKLVDSGVISTSWGTTQNNALTSTISPVTLTAGTYLYACTGDQTQANAWMWNLDNGPTFAIGPFLNAVGTRVAVAANTSVAGALPSTLGSLTAMTTTAAFSSRSILFALFEP